MSTDYAVWMVSRVGPKMIVFPLGLGILQWEGANFAGGEPDSAV